MAPFRLEIVSAERMVYEDDVDVLVAPGIDGQLGILPHHAPLLTILQPGEIMIRKAGNESYLAVSGGFMEVFSNKVRILADAAERADEIDEARVEAAMKRAQERLSSRGADIDLQRAAADLRRSQARLKVLRHRRRREGPGPSAPTG
ncbi:MAG: F0F1 ATP synthase subunit epsilon [Chloroflexi bacterium]|nr:F0F1 ATP synthase subunit epsilon [Chloroflexota bacterium]